MVHARGCEVLEGLLKPTVVISPRCQRVEAHALRMRTPHLPKVGPWTEDDEAHLQKVFATFPVWNSEQIAVARRAFQSAVDNIAAKEDARRLAELRSKEQGGE